MEYAQGPRRPGWRHRGVAGLAAGLLGGLLSCRGAAQPTVLLCSDFEQFEGWIPRPAALSPERAHSGRFALRLPEGAEFSPAFHTRLGRAGQPVPRRLALSAWVYAPSGRIRTTSLVVEIAAAGGRRGAPLWLGFDLEPVVKRYQKWERVQFYRRLPAGLAPDDEVKIYLWHSEPGGEKLWLDDLQLAGE